MRPCSRSSEPLHPTPAPLLPHSHRHIHLGLCPLVGPERQQTWLLSSVEYRSTQTFVSSMACKERLGRGTGNQQRYAQTLTLKAIQERYRDRRGRLGEIMGSDWHPTGLTQCHLIIIISFVSVSMCAGACVCVRIDVSPSGHETGSL